MAILRGTNKVVVYCIYRSTHKKHIFYYIHCYIRILLMDEVHEGRYFSLTTIPLRRRNSQSHLTPLLMNSIINTYFDDIHLHIIMYGGKVRNLILNGLFLR